MSFEIKEHYPSLDALHTEQITCRLCPRLVAWGRSGRHQTPGISPPGILGASPCRTLETQGQASGLGLAPGAHGSNRTGRVFTGDGSGNFLFPASILPDSPKPNATHRGDGLQLTDLYITAIVRCAPPANKPSPEEIRNCRPWLQAEFKLLRDLQELCSWASWLSMACGPAGIRCLQLARDPVWPRALYPSPDGRTPWLLCSYHPSLQNTQTGKLTREMFAEIGSGPKRSCIEKPYPGAGKTQRLERRSKPRTADLAARGGLWAKDFDYRISMARIEETGTSFTALPGYERYLTGLDGSLRPGT